MGDREVAGQGGTNVRREARLDDGDLFSRETIWVLGIFLLYSMAMFSLPFVAFFGMRHVLTDTLGMQGFAVNAWSVLACVLTVNAIIMSYAYRGYHEDVEEQHSGPGRSQLNVKED